MKTAVTFFIVFIVVGLALVNGIAPHGKGTTFSENITNHQVVKQQEQGFSNFIDPTTWK